MQTQTIQQVAEKFANEGVTYARAIEIMALVFPDGDANAAMQDALVAKAQAPESGKKLNPRPMVKASVVKQAESKPAKKHNTYAPANANDPSTWTLGRLMSTETAILESRAAHEGESLQAIAKVQGWDIGQFAIGVDKVDERIAEGVATALQVDYVEILREDGTRAAISAAIDGGRPAFVTEKVAESAKEYVEADAQPEAPARKAPRKVAAKRAPAKKRTATKRAPAKAKAKAAPAKAKPAPKTADQKAVEALAKKEAWIASLPYTIEDGETRSEARARHMHTHMDVWAGEVLDLMAWAEETIAEIKANESLTKATRKAQVAKVWETFDDERKKAGTPEVKGSCGCGARKTYRCAYAKLHDLPNLYGFAG